MKGIADTGFLVAFANRSDQHHASAVSVAEQVTEPLLTCEAVLVDCRSRRRGHRSAQALCLQVEIR